MVGSLSVASRDRPAVSDRLWLLRKSSPQPGQGAIGPIQSELIEACCHSVEWTPTRPDHILFECLNILIHS